MSEVPKLKYRYVADKIGHECNTAYIFAQRIESRYGESLKVEIIPTVSDPQFVKQEFGLTRDGAIALISAITIALSNPRWEYVSKDPIEEKEAK